MLHEGYRPLINFRVEIGIFLFCVSGIYDSDLFPITSNRNLCQYLINKSMKQTYVISSQTAKNVNICCNSPSETCFPWGHLSFHFLIYHLSCCRLFLRNLASIILDLKKSKAIERFLLNCLQNTQVMCIIHKLAIKHGYKEYF